MVDGLPFERLKDAHDKYASDHSGAKGHNCPEWDYLYICKDCPEFECCICNLKELSNEKPEDSEET